MDRVGSAERESAHGPDDLAAKWIEDYRREGLIENGDPDAFIERVRGLAEDAGPRSSAARALPLFLERLAILDDSVA